jgi:uncharacterized membrane protein YiaA
MKYFDGSVNDLEKQELKQHLKTCKKCCDEFESLKDIFNCLEEEDNHIEPPVDFEERVMEKVNEYETSRRKKVDGFLMLIYGITVLILGVFTVVFAIRIKGSGTLESFASIDGIQNMLWGVLYFIHDALKQLGAYLKDMQNEIVYYYVFVVGLVVYLIMQKASSNKEKNVNEN